MNILFLSNRGLLPITDGHSRRSFNILKGLCERHDVYLLFLYEKEDEISLENIKEIRKICKYVEYIKCPSKKISIQMIGRLFISLFSKYPYTVWRHYSPNLISKYKEISLKFKFDIIHCDILPISYLVKDERGKKWSITDHDVSYEKALKMSKESKTIFLKSFLKIESIKLKRYEVELLKKENIFIAVSDSDRNTFLEYVPNKQIYVIENGVDIENIYPCSDPLEDNNLLWVGGFNNFSNREGFSYFLEKIYPLVINRVGNIKIDVVGSDVTNYFKYFARKDKSIVFHGYVKEIEDFFANATIFIAPIYSGGGTKLKIIEAMAFGKAIVTTSVGAEGLGAQNGQHYLIGDTPSEFADAVIEILKKPDFRKKLETNSRKFVENKFGWNGIVEKLSKIYERKVAETELMCD